MSRVVDTLSVLSKTFDSTNNSLFVNFDDLKNVLNDTTLNNLNISSFSKGMAQNIFTNVNTNQTSGEIDCSGYNAIAINVTVTGTGVAFVKLKASLISGGTFNDYVDVGLFGSSRPIIIPRVLDFVKVDLTVKSGTATYTVDVQPCNVPNDMHKPTFKEYLLAINQTGVAANTDSNTFDIYNCEWVKSVSMFAQCTQDYEVYYTRICSDGSVTGSTKVGSTNTANGGWWRDHIIASNTMPPAYGFRFKLKNIGASPSNIQAHIILSV